MLMPEAPGPTVRANTTQASGQTGEGARRLLPRQDQVAPSPGGGRELGGVGADPGSVRAKATTASPDATPGSHSSGRRRSRAPTPRADPGQLENDVTLKSARPISLGGHAQ